MGTNAERNITSTSFDSVLVNNSVAFISKCEECVFAFSKL